MTKAYVNIIKKTADIYGCKTTHIDRFTKDNRFFFEAIVLDNYLGNKLYIIEADKDIMIYNEALNCDGIIWNDTYKTNMEKAIALSMFLGRLDF